MAEVNPSMMVSLQTCPPSPRQAKIWKRSLRYVAFFQQTLQQYHPANHLHSQTYEQAAADATPPYWETTILAPGAFNSDDIFVDGLIVGSLFSFVWNALISMSFQLIGFLLTYLLHTTHAAKHGSRAGLGITLIQYGFTFRGGSPNPVNPSPGPPGSDDPAGGIPSDPNAHDFDPNIINGGPAGVIVDGGISTSDWISYGLMIVGWFILIRAVSDFIRARRQEEMVRASPDRGLGVAVVASNEQPETAV